MYRFCHYEMRFYSYVYSCETLQDDLLAELEELEQEDLDRQLLEVGGSEELPNVPTAEPAEPRAARSMS